MEPIPRRWWGGPLDTERLAWFAVTQTEEALAHLVAARDMATDVTVRPQFVASAFAAIEHLRVDGRAAQGWAPLSGFFRAADGWVRLHANYPHHAEAIHRALGGSTREAVSQAVTHRPALEVEQAVVAEHGIASAVRTSQEWLRHPHGLETHHDLWVHIEARDHRHALPKSAGAPLAGVRVLDLTRVIAGPTCSQLLACLGADVLRIDPSHRPELLDQFLSNGMGKRSAVLDLDVRPETLAGLLSEADVVLLGYRPGSLDHHGLNPTDLLDRHPSLIVASLSAWGEHGPWAQRAGFDSIVQAASGIAMRCSTHGRPGALPVQALDHTTGYLLAAEIMRLLAQARSGIVRASLLGAARTLLSFDAPPDEAPTSLEPCVVRIPSPYGPLEVPPPPFLLDGRPLHLPVRGYGSTLLPDDPGSSTWPPAR